MTSESRRQRKLAREIGKEFCGTDKLAPGCHHSGFWTPPLPADEIWTAQLSDQQMGTFAWMAAAKRIESVASPFCHVIDHQWTLVFDDKHREPWGFVTEPYISAEQAKRIEYLAKDAMAPWAAVINVLPPSRSSWNPGSCTPIVVTFEQGSFPTFLRHAILWGLGITA